MTRNGVISVRWTMIVLLALATILQACAGMRPGYEKPTVTIRSFRPIASQGALPNFEIGLHVINPNREPLELQGVAYTISLNGHKLIKGVANELPVIDAYGEGSFKLTATASLFAGIRFISDLMKSPNDSVRYKLEAKLDVGSILPAIRIKDSGEISLRPSGSEL